jgi:indolepyruvate ferredoxin oxidoreductase beta subunit
VKCDILLSGVGGQGILSVAAIIASSALKKCWHVKQSEVHGMSQRGGAVVANLRMSDEPIHSDLIPRGGADMILSLEPMESLRYLEYLAPSGTLVTAKSPVRNIPDYPDLERIVETVRSLPRAMVVDAESLAREAGNALASNMVMVGAASHLLPVGPPELEEQIRTLFERKGERVVQSNLRAFLLGREAVQCAPS